MQLSQIIGFADKELKIRNIPDYPDAWNGLQVENDGNVARIAAAVDANELTIRKATQAGANLLLVHHGLFWGKFLPLTGAAFRKIRHCVKNNLAIYSVHLPLDLHAKIGNNAILAKKLSLKNSRPFYKCEGNLIGRLGEMNLHRDELVRRVEKIVGRKVKLIAGGPQRVKKVGVVSGGGGHLGPALEAGLDTYITGEGQHHTFGVAHENGINIIYAGHYATETFGICALAELLSKKFRVPWQFIDMPSGL